MSRVLSFEEECSEIVGMHVCMYVSEQERQGAVALQSATHTTHALYNLGMIATVASSRVHLLKIRLFLSPSV